MAVGTGADLIPEITSRLRKKYPNARYELDWTTPEELLVGTILAAQCTDERVNRVTKDLFKKYRSPQDFANADYNELSEDVRPTGFYQQKARTIISANKVLVEKFGSKIPRTMDEMLQIPGVARKTANVVLNNAFDIPSGVIVDTHVSRLAPILGLSTCTKPEDIEEDLMRIVPQEDWTFFGPAMVLHGRYTCTAKVQNCSGCILEDICPRYGVAGNAALTASSGSSTGASGAKKRGKSASTYDEDSSSAQSSLFGGSSNTSGSLSASSNASSNASSGLDFLSSSSNSSDHYSSGYSDSYSNTPVDTYTNTNTGSFMSTSESSSSSSSHTSANTSGMPSLLPESWRDAVGAEFTKPYWAELEKFVAEERAAHQVFPPEDEVFTAFNLTPYENVNVLLLGQDPYHDDGQAHGLCFSVKPGIKPPPSLVNMYKELNSDLGIAPVKHGYLVKWAEQGMLMLNAVLTVRAHTPNSHKDRGWEKFTDAVIKAVSAKSSPVVFVLWGGYAQKKEKLIDKSRHTIIKCAHPSPLSANNGFFGSKQFSAINAALEANGKPPIDWRLG